VVSSLAYSNDGLYPEVLEGEEKLKPKDLAESEWQKAYMRTALNPETSFPASGASKQPLTLHL
jgi:hypothetical protein